MDDMTVERFSSERERLDVIGYDETRLSMSNWDHTIDAGFEDALRGGNIYGRYAGWHFNGIVWLDGEQFACEVWVYQSPREVIRADSLQEIMREVSDKYGWD